MFAHMMSDFFRPEYSGGVRFDDPAFGIDWPLPVSRIVERDREFPDFDPAVYVRRYGRTGELPVGALSPDGAQVGTLPPDGRD